MRAFILLCSLFIKTSCAVDNLRGPWSYFNQDDDVITIHDLNPLASFEKLYTADQSFVESPSYFLTRSDYIAPGPGPQIETGFVPSFGNVRPPQPFQPPPLTKQTPNQYRNNHRTKHPNQNKHAINPQSSSQVNKFRRNPYSQSGKQSASIYKPSFIVGQPLSQIRDDPAYHKVRSNVNTQANRLKVKENYPNAVNGDVLEKQQHEYYEPQFEKYVAQNEPHYFNKPQKHHINYDKIQHKNRYPLPNHGHIKVHPHAYKPLKNRINLLKTKQHQTFSEGNNEYPDNRNKEKVTADEKNVLSGGRDILDAQRYHFENQKQNFNNDFSSHVNKHHQGHKLLPHSSEQRDEDVDNTGTDFVPIKTYAQVRHSETIKHLPREAALQEAETFDEVLNAPRLKEAIKTSKAQTVYSEEGYEDVAYDHAGHLKHASNHEGYSGYLKHKDDENKKLDEGKSKGGYGFEGKSKHGSNLSKGKTWSLDEGDNEKFDNKNSFSFITGDSDHKKFDLTGAGSIKLPTTGDKTKQNTFEENNKKNHQIKNESRFKKNNQTTSTVNHSRAPQAESQHKAGALKDKQRYFFRKPDSPPDVEVFDPNFNHTDGPKHGGNYRVDPVMLPKLKDRERLELLEPSYLPTKHRTKNANIVNGHANNANKKQEAVKPNPVKKPQNSTFNDWVGLELVEPIKSQDVGKDQDPLNSQVEIFRSDLPSARKHGGNYRKRDERKKESALYTELEDLENPSEGLHGGNYKTRIPGEGSEEELTQRSGKIASMEEGLPISIINNIAFLTSNMTDSS